MKTFNLILLSTVLSFNALATGSEPDLKILSTEGTDFLKFKVDKELVGATINLLYSNGDVVAKEVLLKKRMVIDFCKVKTGDYTVFIEKDGVKRKIEIQKNIEEGVQCGSIIPISG